MKTPTLGTIVSIHKGYDTGKYGVVTEIFDFWRPSSPVLDKLSREIGRNPEQKLYHVHYIDSHTGKLMVCPDYDRCKHEHTCPIHGDNCGVEQLKPFSEHDLEHFVQEGMVAKELLPTNEKTVLYTICKYCDHFIDPNYPDGQTIPEGVAKYIHLEDGEQEFDHEPSPGTTRTLALWKLVRPDLFKVYEDGAIGPNSCYYPSRRGKTD
jgi:hypothetical protein